MLEWTITCKDWKFDEVDHRSCEERGRLDASIGIAGYYENDDDVNLKSPGMAVRSTGPLDRYGVGAWFRARWHGWSALIEGGMRTVDFTRGSTAPTQTDYGAEVMVHHRFASSPWGVGARAGMIWLDDDYLTLPVGAGSVALEDTISEFGVVVNYFFNDHGNKVSADVTWLQDNSAVRSSSAGYLWDPTKGIAVEDGDHVAPPVADQLLTSRRRRTPPRPLRGGARSCSRGVIRAACSAGAGGGFRGAGGPRRTTAVSWASRPGRPRRRAGDPFGRRVLVMARSAGPGSRRGDDHGGAGGGPRVRHFPGWQ